MLKRLRERFALWLHRRQLHRELMCTVHVWHCSHVRSAINFNFEGTGVEAFAEVRARFPDSYILHVDHDLHVILFSFLAK